MLKFNKNSVTLFFFLLAQGLIPASAQNTVLTTSTAISGGGVSNVLIGPANTYSGIFSGNNNTFIGKESGVDNTDGDNNSFFGRGTGRNNTTGNNNSFMGYHAGYFTTDGSYNSFLGTLTGYSNTTGEGNSYMGYGAGYYNTTGSINSFLGSYAGFSNTTGGSNLFIGYQTGFKNTEGEYNAFTGNRAGYNNTTGSNNTFTGFQAGYTNVTGDYNSFIGNIADATGSNGADLQRATALGYHALVAVNDGLVLGDTANVKVGIGTAYPNQRFTLRGNMNFVAYDNSMMLRNQPFLHFNEHESLALGLGAEIPSNAEKTLVLGSAETAVQIPGILSTYQPGTGQLLTVNQSGKVVLTQPHVQVASVDEWADKVFEEGYALRPLNEVEEFVKNNKHLPEVPSAAEMVAEGMDVTTIIAKQMEKIEELTLYVIDLEKRLKELEQN